MAGRPDPGSTTATRGSVQVDGRERTYVVVAPAVLAPQPWLVLVFHGSNQTGERVRRFAGGSFDELAQREGIVVAYPDAYQGLWNEARIRSRSKARADGVDDVAFAVALIERLTRQYGVPADRVVVAGYSNGGQLVIRLIHEVPDRLTVAAVVAATQPAPDNFLRSVDRGQGVPVVLVNGTKDPIVPFTGGVASLWGFRPRGEGMSAPATAAYFAGRNGISTPPTVETLPRPDDADPTSVTLSRYRHPGRPPVDAYVVQLGGHVIPNPYYRAPFLLGRTTRSLHTADAIWTFAAEAVGS